MLAAPTSHSSNWFSDSSYFFEISSSVFKYVYAVSWKLYENMSIFMIFVVKHICCWALIFAFLIWLNCFSFFNLQLSSGSSSVSSLTTNSVSGPSPYSFTKACHKATHLVLFSAGRESICSLFVRNSRSLTGLLSCFRGLKGWNLLGLCSRLRSFPLWASLRGRGSMLLFGDCVCSAPTMSWLIPYSPSFQEPPHQS